MPRPTGTSTPKKAGVAADLLKGNIEPITNQKKYRKEIIWDAEMKEILEAAAKKKGMTVSGFIKYCVMEELYD